MIHRYNKIKNTSENYLHYHLNVWGETHLFRKDTLNWSKVRVKTFIMLQTMIFQINAVLLNIVFTKESQKLTSQATKCFQHW